MPPASQRDTREAEARASAPRACSRPPVATNRGQRRAFVFALGYLGWFVSP
jgi:uncharacterized membrane protein